MEIIETPAKRQNNALKEHLSQEDKKQYKKLCFARVFAKIVAKNPSWFLLKWARMKNWANWITTDDYDYCRVSESVSKILLAKNISESVSKKDLYRFWVSSHTGLLMHKVSLIRDSSPYRYLFDIFGPYWVPIYLSGSLFAMFWLNPHEKFSLVPLGPY